MRLKRWIHPPGTAPGTITDRPEKRGHGRAALTRFSPSDFFEVHLEDLDIINEDSAGIVRWVDVEGQDANLVDTIGQRLKIHPLVIEDVVNRGQRSKVEDFEGCLFVVVHHLERRRREDAISAEQVSLVLKDGILVSFKEHTSDVFGPVKNRLRSGTGKIRSRGPDYLAYALIDAVVDHCLPLIDDIGERIERAEESVSGSPDPANASILHAIRRDLILIRREVWPMRDMVNRLTRTESELVQHETRVFLRDVADHLALVADTVETYQEFVSGLMDLHLSAMSNRLNEVMKVLTMIATIFIPLSFIAGVYGMNFSPDASPWNMPELGWYWGYPAALGIMAAVALGLLIYFKRRRWW